MGHIVLDLTNLAYQPTTKSREQPGHPKRRANFAMSERKSAYPAHAPDMHEDEDKDDTPLVWPASRKEFAEERCDPATDDEDLLPTFNCTSKEKKRTLQYGRIQLQNWNKRCQGTRASEQRIPRFWAEKQKVKPYATS